MVTVCTNLVDDGVNVSDLVVIFSVALVQRIGVSQVVNGDSEEDVQQDV